MSSLRVLTLGLVVIAVAVLAAACSSDSAAPETPTDPVLAQGQQIYNDSCATCHGKGGGGGMGPKLADVVASKYPDIADQEAVVRDGKSGMPAFGDRLSDDEIEAVSRYEREWLGERSRAETQSRTSGTG